MKKMLVVVAVVAMAFAACGKKQAPAAPAAEPTTEPAPADGAAPAEGTPAEGAPAEGAPAEGAPAEAPAQ